MCCIIHEIDIGLCRILMGKVVPCMFPFPFIIDVTCYMYHVSTITPNFLFLVNPPKVQKPSVVYLVHLSTLTSSKIFLTNPVMNFYPL